MARNQAVSARAALGVRTREPRHAPERRGSHLAREGAFFGFATLRGVRTSASHFEGGSHLAIGERWLGIRLFRREPRWGCEPGNPATPPKEGVRTWRERARFSASQL